MLRYIAGRIALAIPTLLAISFLVFFASYLSPADPVDIIAEKGTPEIKARVRHEYGLDRPPLVRYADYVWRIVTRGDFGRSYQTRESVTAFIQRGFPNTAFLAASALLVSLIVGISVGVLAAVYANRVADRIAMTTALIGVAVPSFVLGPVLVLLFSVQQRWLPAIGFALPQGKDAGRMDITYIILPVVVLAARSTALIARLTRSAMLETLNQDYIRTARAKGLSYPVVLFKHALKNAFPPILTAAGTTFGYLLSGSFVVEQFFTIPGIGSASITSILKRDFPVTQGLTLLLAFIFVVLNLIVDILYGVLDPRARVGKRRAGRALPGSASQGTATAPASATVSDTQEAA